MIKGFLVGGTLAVITATAQAECDLMCAAIYSWVDCACCPIKGLECDGQYNGQFCDKDGNIDLPVACGGSSTKITTNSSKESSEIVADVDDAGNSTDDGAVAKAYLSSIALISAAAFYI